MAAHTVQAGQQGAVAYGFHESNFKSEGLYSYHQSQASDLAANDDAEMSVTRHLATCPVGQFITLRYRASEEVSKASQEHFKFLKLKICSLIWDI